MSKYKVGYVGICYDTKSSLYGREIIITRVDRQLGTPTDMYLVYTTSDPTDVDHLTDSTLVPAEVWNSPLMKALRGEA